MDTEKTYFEAVIKEKDSQLSRFKSILQEKEIILQKLLESEAKLSMYVREMQVMCQSKEKVIACLTSDLSRNSEEVLILQGKLENVEVLGKMQKGELCEKNLRDEELEKHVEMLQGQIQTFSSEKEQVAMELEELRANTIKKEEIIEILKSDKHHLVSQYSELQQELRASKSPNKLSQNSKQIRKLQSKMRFDRKKISSVMTERNDAVRKREELEAELTWNREITRSALEVRDEALRKREEFKVKLARNKKVINSMMSERDEKMRKREEFETELTSNRMMVSNVMEERVEAIGKEELEAELAENARVIKRMMSERDMEVKKREVLEMKLTSNRKTMDSVMEERDEAVRKREVLEMNLTSNRKMISSVMEERDESVRKREVLEMKLTSNRKTISSVMEERDEAVRNREVLETKLTSNRKTISSVMEERDDAVRTREVLEIKLAQNMKVMSGVVSEKEKDVKKMKTLETELVIFKKKNHQLKEHHDSVMKFVESKLSQQALMTDRLAEEINIIEQMITSVREQHLSNEPGQEAEVVSVTQELAQTVKEKKNSEGKLQEMRKRLHSSEQEKVKLSSALEDLRTQADGIHNIYKEKLVSIISRYILHIYNLINE